MELRPRRDRPATLDIDDDDVRAIRASYVAKPLGCGGLNNGMWQDDGAKICTDRIAMTRIVIHYQQFRHGELPGGPGSLGIRESGRSAG